MEPAQSEFIDERIEKLLKRIEFTPGKNIVVFVDTGAAIDAEGEFTRWKLQNSNAKLEKIYNSLFNKGLQLYVTAPVFEEMSRHHCTYVINGRPEISDSNFKIVERLHKDYESFLQNVHHNEMERDSVRRDVYWASYFAFKEDDKKGERDPISYVDREFISSAVLARYAHSPHNVKNASGVVERVVKRPDKVILLSPDSHVKKTIDMLLNIQPQYDGIKTVSSRQT